MHRTPVNSSDLRSVGYEQGTLEVEFKGGRIYQYFDVTEDVYEGLMNADSLGTYFNANIKNDYRCEKVR